MHFFRNVFAGPIALSLMFSPSVQASELGEAISAKDLARVEALIASGANLNEKSNYGRPLNMAAFEGAVEISVALIDAGADLESPGVRGAHPLLEAAARGNTAIAKVLIQRGRRSMPWMTAEGQH